MKKTLSSTAASTTKKATGGKSSPKKKAQGKELDGTKSSTTHSIRREEVKQLEQFVKKRSQELDDEILTLREKLKNANNFSASQSKTLERSYKPKALVGSIENDSLNHLVGDQSLSIHGSGMNKVNLDPRQLMNESRHNTNILARQSKRFEDQLEETKSLDKTDRHKDHLITFLAKLRLSTIF